MADNITSNGEVLSFAQRTINAILAKVARVMLGFDVAGVWTDATSAVGFPVKLATDGLTPFAGIGALTDAPAAIGAATTAASASNNALLRLIANLLNQPVGPLGLDSASLTALENITSTLDTSGTKPGSSTTPLYTTAVAPTVLFAPISAAAVGYNSLVNAAGSGVRIRVIGFALVSTAANAATFASASTALTGAMAFAANGGISAPQSAAGLFQTAANEALRLNLSTAAQVSGWLVYQLV